MNKTQFVIPPHEDLVPAATNFTVIRQCVISHQRVSRDSHQVPGVAIRILYGVLSTVAATYTVATDYTCTE